MRNSDNETISTGASHDLAGESRRKRWRPGLVRVALDRHHLGYFDPVELRGGSFEVDEETSQIELYGSDAEGELLLAVLPAPGCGDHRIKEASLRLGRGQRFAARYTALPDLHDEGGEPVRRWQAQLRFAERRPLRAASLFLQRRVDRSVSPLTRFAYVALFVLILGACSLGGVQIVQHFFEQRLAQYNALITELGFDQPFTVEFEPVAPATLELAVSLDRNIVGEVFVDWNDPADPDPVGGRRIYPGGGHGQLPDGPAADRLTLVRLRHTYRPGQPNGLRTAARVRIVPRIETAVPPAPLAEEKLTVEQPLWVLPGDQGIVLDPAPAQLTIDPPPAGVVTDQTRLTVRASLVSEPVHLLGYDPRHPERYRHLATLLPPPFGSEEAYSVTVDLGAFDSAGPLRVVAISSRALEVSPDGLLDWRSIPQSVARDEVELHRLGAILAPRPGDTVTSVESVRATVNMPDAYAAVLIAPSLADGYFVQQDGVPTRRGSELSLPVTFGGRDSYEVWIGVTSEPGLFQVGDRLWERPQTDSQGRPVHWLGPVRVHHE